MPEAVEFMMANSSMTEPTAMAEVTRYCSWPTQASSYLTGCLEILRIRDRYLSARGTDASDIDALRDFHDAITGSGTLPIALAERAVMATVARPHEHRHRRGRPAGGALLAGAAGGRPAAGHRGRRAGAQRPAAGHHAGRAGPHWSPASRRSSGMRSRRSPMPADPEQALTLAALRQSTDATLALLRADAHAYTRRRDLGPAGSRSSRVPSYQPLREPADGRDMVARWRAIAPTLAEMEASVRRGLAEGRSPIRASVQRVVEQLDDVLARPDADGPLLAPLAQRPDSGWTDAELAGVRHPADGRGRPGGAAGHGPLPDLHCR